MPDQLNITSIPSNRIEFIDPRTGMVSREWYRFFLNLFTLAGSGSNQITLDELQIGPPPQPDLGGGGGGSGTVTSVGMSVPTGLSVAGSPVTTSGTFAVTYAAGYSIPTTAKQTEWDTAYTDRLKWDGGATDLVAATGRTSLGGTTVGQNFFTLTNPSAITFVQINADNSITTMDAPTFRTAIGAGTGGGSVTSVAMTVPTGLSISGSPITSSGTLAVTFTAGYSIPTTASQTNWDSAYTQRLQWDGGSTNLVAATGRTSLGATTVGGNMFTLTNPSAITFPRFNADNTVSALDAATFRTAIGAGIGSGTVTSVDATGGTGISVSGGPITTSGTLTITNTAPDQVVSLTQGGTTTITGTYPNFTISSSDAYTGTVTSVATAGSVSGLTLTGGPITTSGTITLGGTLDLSSPPAIGSTTPAAGTFTDVAIPTATGESTLLENTTITGWIYSENSFSISAQELQPNGLFFSPDGLKMYVNGQSGDDVNEYTLGTAWNITTATFVTSFSTASQDPAPADLFFKPDGLTMFVLGGINDTVYQYTLGTAWSVATASYASKSFSVTTQDSTSTGIWFKPDGTAMYMVGSLSDTVYQYTLGTAWDISTASYASKSYSVASQEATATQVNLSADGTKMWVLGSTGDKIWEYTLGTAWDVSTATPVNNFYVGFQETSPSGMFIDSSAANRVFIVGSTTDAVYQYNTAANSLEIDTEKLYVDGQVSVNGNFVANSNAYVDGALTVQGAATFSSISVLALSVSAASVSSTLTATSTLSLTGSTSGTASFATSQTTANTSICTSQTSGTFTLGGTSGTGTITLGRATTSQTTNIQAGATASGNTKTINMGTAGVSGSTTNINIGSAVSGALGTTIIQSPTLIATGQTSFGGAVGSESLRVVTTASAVNWLQAQGGTTGNSPVLSALGSDTNIDLTLTPKGTGVVRTSGTGIRLYGSSSGYVGLKGAAAAGSTTYTLPAADGTSGQVLSTDGASTLSWATPSGGSSNITAQGMWENALTISSNYTITSGNSAMSAGPITIASGVSVTVPSGSRWVVV